VLVKRALFLLNAALAIAILHLISQVHLPSFVTMLPKYLKDSKLSSCFWSIIILTGKGCLEILITTVIQTNKWPTNKKDLMRRHYKDFTKFVTEIAFDELNEE
jgi:hypothetical protein